MTKSFAAIVVTAAAVLAAGGIVALNNQNDNRAATSNSTGDNSGASQTADGGSGGSMAGMDRPMMPERSGDGAASNAVAETNTVTIDNFDFSPASIRVKKGTTVTWTNQDSVKHDIMPDNPSEAFQASELLGKGESYSFTFNTVGTYSYFCSPHPYMKATVEVVE